MLRVFLGSASSFYLDAYASSFTGDDGRIYKFSPLIGPFSGTEGCKPIEIHGKIHDGELTSWGDRSCTHFKWDGTLALDGKLSRVPIGKKSNGTEWIYHSGIRYDFYPLVGPSDYFLSEELKPSDGLRFFVQTGPGFINQGYWRKGRGCSRIRKTYNLKSGKYRTHILPSGSGLSLAEWLALPWDDNSTDDRVLIKTPSGAPTLTPQEIYKILNGFRRVKLDASTSRLASFIEADGWGELSQAAIDSIPYADTNGLQYFPELASFTSLLRQFTSVRYKSAKDLASAYLAFQYGARSLVRDSITYLDGLRRFRNSMKTKSFSTVHSSSSGKLPSNPLASSISVERHYKIAYRRHENVVLDSYRILREWGLAPTLVAAWDLVPFSFVVDWFLDISSCLEQIDNIPKRAMYKVIGVTRSEKISSRLQLQNWSSDVRITGQVQYIFYRREVQKELDVPRFSYSKPTGFSNYAEATALIIQRRTK